MAKGNALRGDEAALFSEHADRLLRVVRYAVTASDAVIEDACSFAWMQLLRTQPERQAIFAWLKTVAVREAIRIESRARRDDPVDTPAAEAVPAAEGGPELVLEAREALSRVAALPPRQRQMIARQVAGLTYDEIAADTGDTRRTVERQMMRAKRRLRTG